MEDLNQKNNRLIGLVCYCLMPNHFHFLLKQTEKEGISRYMSLVQNSYTKYFNARNNRAGPLFQGYFKAVRVENDEQLLHLSRYIHLNPYSSYIVKTLDDLVVYSWSSFSEYLGIVESGYLRKKIILDQFKSSQKYKKFVFDQADYQRELGKVKHLVLES